MLTSFPLFFKTTDGTSFIRSTLDLTAGSGPERVEPAVRPVQAVAAVFSQRGQP